MSDKRAFVLAHPEARRRAMSAVADAPAGYAVTVGPANRTLDQNAAQWPILAAFASQLMWPVNGQMVRMSDAEWKDVLTAAFKGEKARLAMGLDGGVVMLGQRTSKFDKAQFSEWLDFLHATAVARGVELNQEENDMTEATLQPKTSLLPEPPANGIPAAFFGYAGWATEMAMKADNAEMLAECIEREFIDEHSTMLNNLSILGYCLQRGRHRCAEMLQKRGWK